MSINNAVKIAETFIKNHPYILDGEIIQNPEYDRIPLDAWNEKIIPSAEWEITFTPKNGVRAGYKHSIFIAKADEKSVHWYKVIVPCPHVIPRFTQNVLFESDNLEERDIENNMIAFFFITFDSNMAAVIEHGHRDYRVPREWRKSYDKAIAKYSPEFVNIFNERIPRKHNFGQVYKKPEFYPVGTIVQFDSICSLCTDHTRMEVVHAVFPNGPDSYVIKTGRQAMVCGRMEDVTINTGHVVKLIFRGQGGCYRTGHYHDKKAVKKLWEEVSTTVKTWDPRNTHGFIIDYILCYYSGKLPDNFVDQFDVYKFIAAVCTEQKNEIDGFSRYIFIIDKKKFKKQLKRVHAYLQKLSDVTQENLIDEESYYERVMD